MALRDQPYIPFYVQDFMTDEKLSECSAKSTGVYIRIMCLMHKSAEYGTILLKQKDKQTSKQINNFALKLVKHLPYSVEVIESGLNELINEGVLIMDADKLMQKRMIKDNNISIKRSEAGKKGGKQTQFAKAKIKAKHQANSEDEYEDEAEVNKDIILPFLSKEFQISWIEFIEHRKAIKKKMTELAKTKTLNRVVKLSGNNESKAIKLFDQSIEMGWAGLFELKDDHQDKPKSQPGA